ncbi:pentapeptide repeat-containing protein [Candidatus Poribacteria bacterium]|nr:pentapeptide repeat-containing protein [Candidatus Poribacteria bacterium]
MRRATSFSVGLLIAIGFAVAPVAATRGQDTETVRHKPNDLARTLEQHKRWLDSHHKEGRRAVLRDADLRGADLHKVDLRMADLHNADLRGANLTDTIFDWPDMLEANLRGAKGWSGMLANKNIFTLEDLRVTLHAHLKWLESHHTEGAKADLSEANLRGANLSKADLSEADLRGTNMRGANLSEADLSEADLREANLQDATFDWPGTLEADLRGAKGWSGKLATKRIVSLEDLRMTLHAHLKWLETHCAEGAAADLTGADLSRANLRGGNLTKAVLRGTNLFEANLFRANLRQANLSGANLSGANLRQADLSMADLSEANLTGAILNDAILNETVLIGTDLTGALFFDADVFHALYEPKPEKLPEIYGIAYAKHIDEMNYILTPYGLVELRQAFKDGGLRKQERELTYAIKHAERLRSGFLESSLLYAMFEFTCKYGLAPFRPLVLLFVVMAFFAVLYIIVLRIDVLLSLMKKLRLPVCNPTCVEGRLGRIWKVRQEDSIHEDKNARAVERVFAKGLKVILLGLYFSLQSAFYMGWRDFNVGNWIARIQREEYSLKATGLIRTLSGIQSLISLYLLVLFLLTYFGRPFDNL